MYTISSETLGSICGNVELVKSGATGYKDVPLSMFDSYEQDLIKGVLALYTDEPNYDSVVTIQQQSGIVTGVFGGTVWANKEGNPIINFGGNVFPLEVREGVIWAGKAKLVFEKSKITVNGVKTFIPEFCVTDPNDDELFHQVGLFFKTASKDTPKITPTQQVKLVDAAIKSGDLKPLANALTIKGTGGGYPVKMVDVVRPLIESNIKIPNGGLQFQVSSISINHPPADHLDYGHSVVIDLVEAIPFTALYIDKKASGAITEYKSPTMSVSATSSSQITKSLVDQETGEWITRTNLKTGESEISGIVKATLDSISKGEMYLSINAFNSVEPKKRMPIAVLLKGQADSKNALAVAEALNGVPANRALPFPLDDEDDSAFDDEPELETVGVKTKGTF